MEQNLLEILDNYTVLLGGTFNPIHDGHRKLLETAFTEGSPVIGLTSDSLAQKTRDESRPVDDFETRKLDLAQEAREFALEYNSQFKIVELDDPFKLAQEISSSKTLIVSPEPKTVRRAEEINQKRLKVEKEPHKIKIVDPVYAEDGNRISSTRIVNGEIDESGNLLE